jgi:hypothetical protein
MTVELINIWHEKARPKPTADDLRVQVGCHFEEVAEMLEEMQAPDEFGEVLLIRATMAVWKLAEALKSGAIELGVRDRGAFLDALADQIVTATGVGHCAHMNITEAVRRVNESNWSKFKNGEPQRDMHGKITKADSYVPPDLTGLY